MFSNLDNKSFSRVSYYMRAHTAYANQILKSQNALLDQTTFCREADDRLFSFDNQYINFYLFWVINIDNRYTGVGAVVPSDWVDDGWKIVNPTGMAEEQTTDRCLKTDRQTERARQSHQVHDRPRKTGHDESPVVMRSLSKWFESGNQWSRDCLGQSAGSVWLQPANHFPVSPTLIEGLSLFRPACHNLESGAGWVCLHS